MPDVRPLLGRVLLLTSVGCLTIASSGLLGTPAAHAASKATREQGAALFHEKGCEHCHGVDGVGSHRGPDLSGVGRSMHKTDIERQIRQGGKEMPAFGDALTDDEVQNLVAYLAAKKKKVAKPVPAQGT